MYIHTHLNKISCIIEINIPLKRFSIIINIIIRVSMYAVIIFETDVGGIEKYIYISMKKLCSILSSVDLSSGDAQTSN